MAHDDCGKGTLIVNATQTDVMYIFVVSTRRLMLMRCTLYTLIMSITLTNGMYAIVMNTG